MAAVVRLQGTLLRRILPVINRRLISSTPEKRSETACAANQKSAVATQKSKSPATTQKNWVSYGFETKSEKDDLNALHSLFFASITLCTVFVAFLIAYVPDYNLSNWAQREAFLELKRREMANLPLIDPNLVDPSKVGLPDDAELGDTEIIV